MKKRLHYTALLIEYAFKSILFVWFHKASVTWNREWATVSMTVNDLKDDEVKYEH